jgi:hypothetical protein
MYKSTFGTKQQITFNSESEFYELLGFLAKSNGTTVLVWEPNDQSGAWAQEGRILFFITEPTGLRAQLLHTAGVGNIVSRVNCNEFLDNIRRDHAFVLGETQDAAAIRNTVPTQYQADFDTGLHL